MNVKRTPDPAPMRAALAALTLAGGAIVGAWLFQFAGYLPCELCLEERWPYYVGVPLAALTALLCWRGPKGLRAPFLALLGLVFVGSAIFGVYHAGVEWGFWQGPSACAGALTKASSMSDFMQQLKMVKVIRCDAVAIRILGLSLAGWNAVISAFVAAIAFAGARSAQRA